MPEIVTLQRETWNNYIIDNNGSFLQSWEWGEFQESVGRKIWRLAIPSKNGNTDSKNYILCVQYPLPLKKSYLYCPRIIIPQDFNFELLMKELRGIAKQAKSLFLKIDPELEMELEGVGGFKKSFKQIQPKNTIIVNLEKTEEELQKEMKPKTRYNIRIAQKRELEMMVCETIEEKQKYFDEFYELLEETASRNKFYVHSKGYYETQLAIVPFTKLFLVKYQNKIVAGALLVFFGARVTYLHGASGGNNKNLMAPYLLHWEIIRYAKNQGYKEYDFWGISSASDVTKDTWGGITRFKKGFGGQEIHYTGAYDYIFNIPWYHLYRITKKVVKRGF